MARDFKTRPSYLGANVLVSTDAPNAAGDVLGNYAAGLTLSPSSSALPLKPPVRVASSSNVTVSGPGTTIQGITMANGDRVLLTGQTTGSQNGIYVFNGSAAAMTRATDADSAADLLYGFEVQAVEGNFGQGSWIHVTTGAITVGTTTLVFRKASIGAQLSHAPDDHGLLGWTHDPSQQAATGIQPTSQQIQLGRIMVPRTCTISTLVMGVVTAGATFTAANNFGAFYDAAGNRLQVSASGAADTAWGTAGSRDLAMAGSFTVIGGDNVWIFAAILCRATTIPLFARINAASGATSSANLSIAAGRYISGPSTQTAMPATITLSAQAYNTNNIWFGCK